MIGCSAGILACGFWEHPCSQFRCRNEHRARMPG